MGKFDIFISHASEDKEEVVIPIKNILEKCGLKIWIDIDQLHLGDSIREKIDQGLSQSKFGIVILSPNYLVTFKSYGTLRSV